MEFKEDDYLMLSGLQHFIFCRRQWALIHIEQQWVENYQTTAGEIMHKRAHDETLFELRGNTLTVRGLRIVSKKLGLSGQCDVVEFQKAQRGITLHNYAGAWSVIPVEYKRGSPKEGQEDEIQLCAQAMCLEEMFLTDIAEGYLYYGKNKRRSRVAFTSELREAVESASAEMHQLFIKGYTPLMKKSAKCRACSLNEICIPQITKQVRPSKYIEDMISIGGTD